MKIEEIKEIIKWIEGMDIVKDNPVLLQSIKKLEDDIRKSIFTVVVLGEFKRGKSTFVNALLGTPLLPMNILPETATINAIMYNDKPMLSVVRMDGSQEEGEVSYEYLQQFSASNSNDEALKSIKYIKIGYPLDLLKNRIVLVDTPGVSDLNQQRCDITYQFLPKANAVIFLLDANSPLKKSEKEFIETELFPLGIRDIIFLANKYDCIDEEEDGDDFLDDLKIRLSKAFQVDKVDAPLKEIEIYPVSALDALDGIEEHNSDKVRTSGILQIKKRLIDILQYGDLEKRKVISYNYRLQIILKQLIKFIESYKAIKESDRESLQKACDALLEIQEKRENNKKNIRAYAEKQKATIYAMTDKSIRYFQRKLTEEIMDSIQSYNGADFKEFVEHKIARSIKNNFENWVRNYTPYVDTALSKMGQELANGLSWYLKKKIQILTNRDGELKITRDIMNVEAEDVSIVNLQAGVAAAVGAVGLLAVLGSVVMPFVSMAALPYLRQKMLKEKLQTAKINVIPVVQQQIAEGINRLQYETHKYIDRQTENIIMNTEYAYQNILNQMQENINKECAERKKKKSNTEYELRKIEMLLHEVQKVHDTIANK
ncbi:dynamin family protein [Mitsuokella multacida]|uniref:dynamin family protein n=1 Tax=Mitsuokella multacida TaxID=52226 RepID=UPI00242AAA42|nr:dynamin family protein [Mitsuokella multacida]